MVELALVYYYCTIIALLLHWYKVDCIWQMLSVEWSTGCGSARGAGNSFPRVTVQICSILVQCLERAGRSHLEAINLLLLLLPLQQHLLLSTSSTYTQSAPARVIATIKMILMILIQVLLFTHFCVSEIACSKQMTEGYKGVHWYLQNDWLAMNSEHKVEQLA